VARKRAQCAVTKYQNWSEPERFVFIDEAWIKTKHGTAARMGAPTIDYATKWFVIGA
jgi:hypothetical protein